MPLVILILVGMVLGVQAMIRALVTG